MVGCIYPSSLKKSGNTQAFVHNVLFGAPPAEKKHASHHRTKEILQKEERCSLFLFCFCRFKLYEHRWESLSLICSYSGIYAQQIWVYLKSLSLRIAVSCWGGVYSISSCINTGINTTWCDVSDNSMGDGCSMLSEQSGGSSCWDMWCEPCQRTMPGVVVTSGCFDLGHELRVAVLSGLLGSILKRIIVAAAVLRCLSLVNAQSFRAWHVHMVNWRSVGHIQYATFPSGHRSLMDSENEHC